MVSSSVDWDLARSIAGRVAGNDPFEDSYLVQSLEPDLENLTAQAEELVAVETGLPSLAGPARSRVADRMMWVEANLNSFDRLMRPLLGRLDEGIEDEEPGLFSRITAPLAEAVGPRVAAAEMGALLGWMSTRVIGQYDLLIIEDERPEDQDWVYYVAPNVLSLEKRYGFPPKEFRLWIALHECTHRAQFTGVPWLRPYFLSLVNELLDSVDPDPQRVMATIKQAIEDRKSGQGSLDGGISQLLASPEQRLVLDKVTGLMSLLEGHGDIVMDRAGEHLIPSQPRFARVMSQRRSSASGPSKLLQKVLGFEAKLAQYAEGETFVQTVEADGGRELFDQVWTSAEMLPDIEEIRAPELWIKRVNASAGA